MGKLAAYRNVLLCSSFCAALGWAMPGQAQMFANYDNNVVVDLSVLEDGGASLERRSAANPFGEAQMPPDQMPRSRLLGIPDGVHALAPLSEASHDSVITEVPQSRLLVNSQAGRRTGATRITLKKPTAPAKPQVGRTQVAKSAPKPMVKAPTQPVEVVKQTPPPAPKAAPVKAEAPAPIPEEKVEVAQTPAPKPEAPKVKKPAETEVAKAEPKPPVKVEPAPEPDVNTQRSGTATPPPPPPPTSMEPKKVESALSQKTEPKQDSSSTAALTTSTESENSLRVSFVPGRSKLPSSAQSDLQALATELKNRPDDRVQLQAYAGGDDLTASKARRLSLSRALAVRSYLIEQGVRSTRIDVRALGNKTTQEPFDRVDARITPR